jgi:metalloendopeptidase OMA1, mitochondrial
MRPQIHCCVLLLLCLGGQACAREHIVQTPTTIKILTKEELASRDGSAPLVTDVRILEPVLRVASRLIAAARRSEYGARARALCWVIAVYKNAPHVPPVVRPDGSMVVSTGTFRLAETEAGLAAVLTHELVHALAHAGPSVSPVCVRTIKEEPAALFTLDEEQRADEMGLMLMADAGYDPRELLGLWERMKREQNGAADEVLVHITYERRMEQIAQGLPHALMRYEHANRAPQKVLPLE